MKELTKAEELILLTIWRMGDNTYGVGIKQNIQETTGKEFSYGTLYFLLDQLTVKEYVYKVEGESTPERGGRRKTYYRLTDKGVAALKASVEMYRKVWGDMNALSFESGPSS